MVWKSWKLTWRRLYLVCEARGGIFKLGSFFLDLIFLLGANWFQDRVLDLLFSTFTYNDLSFFVVLEFILPNKGDSMTHDFQMCLSFAGHFIYRSNFTVLIPNVYQLQFLFYLSSQPIKFLLQLLPLKNQLHCGVCQGKYTNEFVVDSEMLHSALDCGWSFSMLFDVLLL